MKRIHSLRYIFSLIRLTWSIGFFIIGLAMIQYGVGSFIALLMIIILMSPELIKLINNPKQPIKCSFCNNQMSLMHIFSGRCNKCYQKYKIELEQRNKKWEKQNQESPPSTMQVVGNVEILGKKTKKALEQNKKKNEKVLFCLNGIDDTQTIVALEKRLIIIKVGFMAGATFGCRVASFFYKDITSIEVNTALIAGVIEVCTPSNQGNPEKDYWASGNNSPWKSSNCIPISKNSLKDYKPFLTKIQTFIEKAKSNKLPITNNDNMASQIGKLHKLYKSGALNKKEFEAAKKKLIN